MPTTTLDAEATTYEGTAARILEMLGNGLSPTVVSSALGVSESYISQLLGEEAFSYQVTSLRYQNLQAATTRDRRYDTMEDTLLAKLEDCASMMYKPMEIVRALTAINQAKRRGADTPANTVVHNTIVQLTLPTVIASRFITNAHNQVVAAGEQELVTIASSNLASKLLGARNSQQIGELYDPAHTSLTISAVT
jgi:hypothetical protein